MAISVQFASTCDRERPLKLTRRWITTEKVNVFSPSDLVATALGSCMLTIMGMRAVEMNIDLKGTKIEVEKIMKSDPRRIGGLNLTFHFPGSLELNERQQKILQKAAETCPVAFSINPAIELNVNFNWENVRIAEIEK
jgi:uncharacterized OsmC-like protein